MKILKTESDEALLAHATSTVEEINKIVKQFLQPQQNLEKTIYVMEAPPDS